VADHITEEEQIEALKRWWDDNGKQTIVAIVLIVGGYFGWQGWTQHVDEQAAAASLVYQDMLDNMSALRPGDKLAAGKQADINRLADSLKSEYSSSQYAFYAALIKAKLAVENDDLDAAVSELQWALDNSDAEVDQNIARLRLARVEAARGNLDSALQLVQGVDVGAMKSAYDEAKGDFYLQQGNSAAAYTAYQAALVGVAAEDSSARALLQLKISQVQPVITEQPEEAEQQPAQQEDA
jgi:predicted negative regulator of RcsB-dependent stress response